jgi:hypothetical protein
MPSNFLGALAAGRLEARDKAQQEEQRSVENNFKNALTIANLQRLNAGKWETRTAPDGQPYQVNSETGESRPTSGMTIAPKAAPSKRPIRQVDDQGNVWLVSPDDPSNPKPVLGKGGKQMKGRVPSASGQRTVGVAPAPIRVVGDQLKSARADLQKAQSTKPLGPLASHSDSVAYDQRRAALPQLKHRADSLSTVYDNMAAQEQGHTPSTDPTAGMADADAWEYWVKQGLSPSAATAKVNARRGTK